MRLPGNSLNKIGINYYTIHVHSLYTLQSFVSEAMQGMIQIPDSNNQITQFACTCIWYQ